MRSVEEIKEMIHANRKMQEILSRRDSAPASLSFIREIDDFVAGSGERVGCILATDCNPEYSLTDIRKVYQDQTGYECCCNEFYICPEEIDGHYAWTIRTLLDRFVASGPGSIRSTSRQELTGHPFRPCKTSRAVVYWKQKRQHGTITRALP